MSSPIIDRFSKFFDWHTLQTICNNVIIIYPTSLRYLVKYQCQQELTIIAKIQVNEKNISKQHCDE